MTPNAQLQRSLDQFNKPLNAALSERDVYTQSHSARVVTIAEGLGRQCGFSESEIEVLRICASFHDIGKIGIPDHILLKPASFEEAEWTIMKSHPVIGERIIRSIDAEGAEEVAQVVRHHHEHFDGGGYPDRLAGEDIPIYSRLLSIADSYDAMRTTRSYHRERTHAEVLEILHSEAGGKHDPYLLGKFIGMPVTEALN